MAKMIACRKDKAKKIGRSMLGHSTGVAKDMFTKKRTTGKSRRKRY